MKASTHDWPYRCQGPFRTSSALGVASSRASRHVARVRNGSALGLSAEDALRQALRTPPNKSRHSAARSTAPDELLHLVRCESGATASGLQGVAMVSSRFRHGFVTGLGVGCPCEYAPSRAEWTPSSAASTGRPFRLLHHLRHELNRVVDGSSDDLDHSAGGLVRASSGRHNRLDIGYVL